MQVHVLKPLRGWRAFAGEVGVIVLGVLIALGFGQVVESIHDRSLARQAQDAIHQEMQADLDRVAFRMRFQACNEKRLSELQALLAGWHGEAAFPAGLHIGFPGDAGLVDQRWQANLASGRFSQQASDVQTDQAGLYTLIHVIDMIENKEIDAWTKLEALELGSQSLSTAAKPMIAEALARARSEGNAIKTLSKTLRDNLGSAGAGRAAMVPANNFVGADFGSTCEPMRKGV